MCIRQEGCRQMLALTAHKLHGIQESDGDSSCKG